MMETRETGEQMHTTPIRTNLSKQMTKQGSI